MTLAAGIGLSVVLLYAWSQAGVAAAAAVAAFPLVAIATAWLLQAGRRMLAAAVILLPMTGLAVFVAPLPLPGASVFPQDVVVLLALGAWAFDWLIFGRSGGAMGLPRSSAHGWPLVLFGVAIVVATLRGHYAYGATLFGQPLRLVFYAGIVVALASLTVEEVYRLLRTALYAGTVITMLWAAYFIASGTSQTDQFELSTGGSRVLGITPSLFCAGALFFALLSLRLSPRGSARMLHLAMAALALVGVVLGFGRAVFAATALVLVLLIAFSGPVRTSLVSVIPLALPFLVLIAIALPRAAPDLVDAARERISAPPATDANVQWREKANEAVFAQVREQPLFGVGFGRSSTFFIGVPSDDGVVVPVRQDIGQDPHNGYLYLWAGGGLAALGTFLLVLGAAASDGIRRFRRTADPMSRVLLLWAAATLLAFLFNAGSGTSFESPSNLLMIWLLISIPAVVANAPREERADAPPARPDRTRDGRQLRAVS